MTRHTGSWQLGKLLICSCSAVIYHDLQVICSHLQWFAFDLRSFAVICDDLQWFAVYLRSFAVICGWFAVICSIQAVICGWFAVICGDLQWFAVFRQTHDLSYVTYVPAAHWDLRISLDSTLNTQNVLKVWFCKWTCFVWLIWKGLIVYAPTSKWCLLPLLMQTAWCFLMQ